ncbi:family S53 protease [Lentinus tigrinus ALCF2SS1-7]|uniref:Family S53 protease n=1 Tax=Lentinus tigrinus ALCF2SS1-6 TaxID=1328759 RepID=A0A5C2S5A2_9APHY|nr:family S53 protease [Lentinus tigrinus ALCF2SS1-6]RPD72856.1 family S53 protease [Lentinus tigrinus ALCF2SS1-7]
MGKASQEATITITLGFPMTDRDGLEATLLDISNPESANYGKWLSKAEVAKFAAPKTESITAVKDWLTKNNITAVASKSGNSLIANVPVHQANALLDANYTKFEHKASGTEVLRTLSYSLPAEIKQHLSFVYPTTQFIPPATGKPTYKPLGSSARAVQERAVPSSCASQTTPACLQALYNIPTTPATASSNNIHVAGYLSEIANLSEVQTLARTYRKDITNPTFKIVSIDGGVTSGQGTFEASLDIDYTVLLATNVPVSFDSVGDSSIQGFFDLNDYLLGLDSTPYVFTTSYGFYEYSFDDDHDIANALCDDYMQLSARGTSILYSSGDGGVSGAQSASCPNNKFVATFPSGCPYVTSVGGTTGVSPETGVDFSSGGFSNIFPRPSFQDSAVSKFITNLGSTYSGLYNASGRGFPDISAQGTNFIVDVAGTLYLIGGTSASSPTFASVVALVNDQLINAGKSPLGWLNPLLYSSAATSVFNDITSGNNPGCNTNGFSAVTGWDAITGLGTVDYARLLTYANSL